MIKTLKKSQRGVVLLASLIILLVVTMLGTAAMQGTGLEFKMAKNTEERQQTFQAAEAVLRRVESNLQALPYTGTQLNSATCATDSINCFEENCAGGLCFLGENIVNQSGCLQYSGAPPTDPIWSDSNALDVWNTATRHRTLTSSGVDVDYIIEFRCFIDNADGGTVSLGNGDAFYRITTLATGPTGRIQVMLQSTYSVPPG